ncbi:MAG: carotenoid biosynthesis protein [Acidobacteriaceae bacterium]
MKILRPAAILLFAAIMYLILVEMVSPWLNLPGLGNIGFTLFFVLFSLVHCCATEGPRRTGLFFAVSAIVTYAMEEIGVRSGLIFGAYHYSSSLGVKLGHVPVLIPLGWFMMIYPAQRVARAILPRLDTRSLPGIAALAALAALVVTAWDLVMDPAMSTIGRNWVWEKGGAYFGVPRHNYAGWLLTTFIVYALVGVLWRSTTPQTAQQTAPSSTFPGRTFAALPVIVYAFFALRYIATNEYPALQVVAVFSMGTPALIALLQVCMRQSPAGVLPVSTQPTKTAKEAITA